jgi:hypothetical protein
LLYYVLLLLLLLRCPSKRCILASNEAVVVHG